jgi:peptidoglycan/LPS O-acetylase OafA/YrhL
MSSKTSDVVGIQYLRGIAAAIVAFYHTGVNSADFAWPAALPRGFGASGVDIFFAISGFIMTYITCVKPVGLGTFVTHRLVRVVPLYWFFTAIVVLVGIIYPAAMLNNKIIWDHILLSLAFIPHVNPITGDTLPFFKLGWTLNYEMYFYICFGVLLLIANTTHRFFALVAFYGASAALFYLIWPQTALTYTFLNPLLLEFVFGAAIAQAWLHGAMDRIPLPVAWAMAIIGCSALLYVGEPGPEHWRVWQNGVPAAMIVASVLIIERHGKLPQSALLLLIGNASYSLYLSHTSTLTVFRIGAKVLHLPVQDPLVGGILVILAFVGAIIGGILCYRFVETPLLKIMRRRLG